jgi:hypothetical protein
MLAAAWGCGTTTTVETYDFSQRAGLYVLGFSADSALRRTLENRLVEDLQARGMVGFASHIDLPDVDATSRRQVIDAANAKSAVGVLLVNEAIPDQDGVIDNPMRISPEHPDLRAFYEYTKSVERRTHSTGAVFAEVNAFLIDGETAKLVWSGTTWSFRGDGQGGAIPGISSQIADELSDARDVLRPSRALR